MDRGARRDEHRVDDRPESLAWRAAEVLWHAMGREGDPRDVHIRIEKTIPSQAGLGGGSGNAAAALVGLNLLWGAKKSRRDLVRLADRAQRHFFHGGVFTAEHLREKIDALSVCIKLLNYVTPALMLATLIIDKPENWHIRSKLFDR